MQENYLSYYFRTVLPPTFLLAVAGGFVFEDTLAGAVGGGLLGLLIGTGIVHSQEND